jgi:hypothetical protein
MKCKCTHTHTHTHTHRLALSILPLLESPAEVIFWNLPEFGRRFRFHAIHGWETCPLEAHFQSREQAEVTWSEIRRVRWSGVFLGYLTDRSCDWFWNMCVCVCVLFVCVHRAQGQATEVKLSQTGLTGSRLTQRQYISTDLHNCSPKRLCVSDHLLSCQYEQKLSKCVSHQQVHSQTNLNLY